MHTRRFKSSTGHLIREKLESKYLKVRITGDKKGSQSSVENEVSSDHEKGYKGAKEPEYERRPERNYDNGRDVNPQDISCYICHEKGHKLDQQTIYVSKTRRKSFSTKNLL